jgi:adhesin/invasin
MNRFMFRAGLGLAVALFALSCSDDGPTVLEVGGVRFTAVPTTIQAGQAFDISVELVSSGGERVTSATDMVTLAINGDAQLTGTTSVAAQNGVATFTGLTTSKTGSNFQFTATSGTFSNTSSSVAVEAGSVSASQTSVSLTPSTITVGTPATATFTFKDEFGNLVANRQVAITSNVAGVTFNPSSGTTTATGTFVTTVSATSASSATVTANVGGVSIEIPTPFVSITPTPTLAQSTLTFNTPLAPNAPSVATFTIRNQLNNIIPAATVSLTSSLAGTSFNPATGTTNAAGVFTSTITPTSAGTGTITATVNGTALAFPISVTSPAVCTTSGTITVGTPLNGTVSANAGCLLNSHPASAFALTIPAGNARMTALTVNGTGGFIPEMSLQAEPPVGTGTFFSNGTATSPTVTYLLPQGTFRALVSSATGGPGSFSLASTDGGVGPPGCAVLPRLLNITATYTGQKLEDTGTPATSDCTVTDDGGTYFEDFFAIFDTRPCTIKVSATHDTFIDLWQINGQNLEFVGGDNNSGGGTDAQVGLNACRAPNGGPLIFGASTSTPGVVGNYTIVVTFPSSLQSVRMSADTSLLELIRSEWRPAEARMIRKR